jgi:uncharacterized membrane protein
LATQRSTLSLSPGVLLGIGLGGFVDGIVLHQILQWHHMLTSAGYPPDSVRNLKINTLFDGLFHATTWLAMAIGLVLLHRVIRGGAAWSGKRLLGGMAKGGAASTWSRVWSITTYSVCTTSRRTPRTPLLGGIGFLVFGVMLVIVGTVVARNAVVTPSVAEGGRARE